jgi:alcohol dehydrogenase class IV
MIAAPTTAGTGSEVTQFTIITDTERDVKMLLKGRSLMPDLVVVEPELSMSMPFKVTAATGLDALTHAVESYTSRKSIPLTETFSLSATRRIFENLPKALEHGDDRRVRGQMALGALEAGIAFNNSSVTLVHGMSRPIGALFHIAHGMSNAMLLSACLRFAKEGAVERFAELGRWIGLGRDGESPETIAEQFLDALDALCRTCQVPTPEEAGIDRAEFFRQIDKMAEDALISGSPANTIRPVTKEDIVRIYESLWK